jgi:hypothetical protein
MSGTGLQTVPFSSPYPRDEILPAKVVHLARDSKKNLKDGSQMHGGECPTPTSRHPGDCSPNFILITIQCLWHLRAIKGRTVLTPSVTPKDRPKYMMMLCLRRLREVVVANCGAYWRLRIGQRHPEIGIDASSYADGSPNPPAAIRTISRPMGSEAVAAGETTFHTCSMFCEQTN